MRAISERSGDVGSAGPYPGLEQSFAVLCADTADPRSPRDYVAAARRPRHCVGNSVAMARDLGRARLLTVDGFGHTEFFNPSACAST